MNNVWLDNGDVNHMCAMFLWEVGVNDMEYILGKYPDADEDTTIMYSDMMNEDFNAYCAREVLIKEYM